MSEITEALLDEYFALGVAEGKEGRDHDTSDGDAQRVRSALSAALAATPSSQSLAEAVERWRRARIAACEVGLQHPDYMDRLNELSEAEDALSVAKEPT